jgi:hypothetical protein
VGLNIYWAPASVGTDITPGLRSEFAAALGRAFGDAGEWKFEYEDVPKLEGMLAAFTDDDSRSSMQRLIDAVTQHRHIRVWIR